MRPLLTLYYLLAYYLSFALFGAVGLVLNLVCFAFGWLPGTPRQERFFQRVLHRHFAVWVGWLRLARLVCFDFDDFSRLPRGQGLVLVSNHPGLMDITYLLARVPEAFCVFKPAIRRNPVLGAAARRAGYLPSDGGHDLLRAAGVKVASGGTLILFPEGSRSPAGKLHPFKSGFVTVARRAAAPIQLVRIACDSALLPKGRALWKLPRLPVQVSIKLGPLLPPPANEKNSNCAAEVEAWYRDELARDQPVPATIPALRPVSQWQTAS